MQILEKIKETFKKDKEYILKDGIFDKDSNSKANLLCISLFAILILIAFITPAWTYDGLCDGKQYTFDNRAGNSTQYSAGLPEIISIALCSFDSKQESNYSELNIIGLKVQKEDNHIGLRKDAVDLTLYFFNILFRFMIISLAVIIMSAVLSDHLAKFIQSVMFYAYFFFTGSVTLLVFAKIILGWL